jgi:hypothetical protein
MKMTPGKIKRLMVTIGIVVVVSIAAIWIAVTQFNSIIDNFIMPKDSRKQFPNHPKQINFKNNQSNTPPSENKKFVRQSQLLPKTKNPTTLPIPQPNENTTHKEISDIMASSIQEGFPELELSKAELIELGEIVMEIRESIQGLRRLERIDENLESFKELEARRNQALLDFERITGMSLLEFLRRVPSKGGITYDDDSQAPAKFKYLHDFKP